MTIEQAKILKDAGWKMSDEVIVEFYEDDFQNHPQSWTRGMSFDDAVDARGHIVSGLPTEKEMMEFLKDSDELDYICSCDTGWGIHLHSADEPFVKSELTEALVEACIKVLKSKEAK